MLKIRLFSLIIAIFLGLTVQALGKKFEIGNLGFEYYDGYYYFLDLENLTNESSSLGVGVAFENVVFSFTLSDGSGTSYNYHITLVDNNTDNVYDDLTDLYYASYDNDTYYDGEGVEKINPGESLYDLVDLNFTALLLISDLYISDLSVSFSFTLNNFTYEDNGTTYIFSGTVEYSGSFFSNNETLISNLSSWSTALEVDIQGSPLNVQPIPEPSSIFLVFLGIGAVFAFRQYWAGKEG